MGSKMEQKLADHQEKKTSIFKRITYVVIIPLLFAIAAALIVATVSGVNVFNEIKAFSQKIPFISSSTQKVATPNSESSGTDISKLEEQVKSRDKTISELQTKLDAKDKELQQSALENNRLQQEIDDLNVSQKASKRVLKDIVSTYETMSPKKAAPIISKMSDSEAMKILTSIKPDILAGIMENLDPTQAARFTELMTNKQ